MCRTRLNDFFSNSSQIAKIEPSSRTASRSEFGARPRSASRNASTWDDRLLSTRLPGELAVMPGWSNQARRSSTGEKPNRS